MSKKVIELIRVSTKGQAAEDRASIPSQRAINRRTEQAYGLEIVKSIEVSDVSGAAVLLAPEIQEMLRLIANPEIHGVVAREFSRLMRPENFSDYALLQAFADTNTVLYLPEGPIDFTSKTGRLIGTIRAAIAGMEKTEIIERIWAAKEDRRRSGKLGQSQIVLPFGVAYDDKAGWSYKPEAERMREAFRRFLAGEQSYVVLARMVGVTPRGMHLLLRNPIYTGWRVIDKKRDPSPSGRYAKPNGRQPDRRKIKRAPEEVIRVKVIEEWLVSEADFQRVQQIMDMKQARHWRSRPDYQHRFTYNGFLTCALCGELVHTKFRRDDYYICKGRHTAHAGQTRYMRRDRLEPKLDELFSDRLTDLGFLREIAEEMDNKASKGTDGKAIVRLETQIITQQTKRQRVLDAFFEGVIDRVERDRRLGTIERELRLAQELLFKHKPVMTFNADLLAEIFMPLFEWKFLNREDKRQILSTLVPDIRVADYKVEGLYLLPPSCGYEDTLTDKDSSQPQA